MTTPTKMKAPRGTKSAFIEGHDYTVPKTGIIDVISATHVETLKRHGFEDHVEKVTTEQVEAMNADEIATFLEENGVDIDGMGKKKQRAAALELVETNED